LISAALEPSVARDPSAADATTSQLRCSADRVAIRHGTGAKRLKRVIDAKRKRKAIQAPSQQADPRPATDLMDALQRSLETNRSGAGASRADAFVLSNRTRCA
jgi:hypothetical protein